MKRSKDSWQEVFGDSIKGLFGHTDSLKERPFRFNGQIMKKDGSTALLGMTASLLKDDTNIVRGIILIFQDITKLVEMEEQVRMTGTAGNRRQPCRRHCT